MGIRVYKPTTNGRRNMTSLDFAEITTNTPEKTLLVSLKNKAGRNNNGRITVRHQGGGHKRHYRLIDFKRNKDGVEAVVKTIPQTYRCQCQCRIQFDYPLNLHISQTKLAPRQTLAQFDYPLNLHISQTSNLINGLSFRVDKFKRC